MKKEGRKKQARSNKQTNKAKQHSTSRAVTFLKKNELPRVRFEPTTFYTCSMRDEKEGRKKQAKSNKQQGKGTQHMHTETDKRTMYIYFRSTIITEV